MGRKVMNLESANEGSVSSESSVPPAPEAESTATPHVRIVGMREDLLHHDPLLDCLVELTRIHGRPSTHAALTAGLPLSPMGLTPSLFVRAAQRAGFASKLVRRSLEKIDPALLPVILLLKDNEACILMGWESAGGGARLLFPDSGQGAVTLSGEALAERYTGIAIFARPHFRFDQRTPEVVEVKERHWFWGAVIDQLPVYRDIIAAAVLVNVFALAMPVFTMNIYDRVVPNNAIETLWMLSGGLLLVRGVDYVIRLLACAWQHARSPSVPLLPTCGPLNRSGISSRRQP